MIEVIGVVLVGLSVGLVSSVLGLGGGVVMVSVLPAISTLGQREAIATSLLTIVLVSSKNVWHFHRHKLVKWKWGTLIGGFSLIASGLAAKWSANFSDDELVFILLLVLLVMILRVSFYRPKELGIHLKPVTALLVAALVGSLSGFLSGLVGVGGGIFVSAVLLSFSLVHHKEVSPTTNLSMVFVGLGAMTSFAVEGINWQELRVGPASISYSLVMFVCAFVSSIWGVRWQNELSALKRKYILLTILIVVFLQVLVRHFF